MYVSNPFSADLASFATPPSIETALEDGERLAKFIDANIPASSRGEGNSPLNRLPIDLGHLRAAVPRSLDAGLRAGQILYVWPLALSALHDALAASSAAPPVRPTSPQRETPVTDTAATAAPRPWPSTPMLQMDGLPLGRAVVPPRTITDGEDAMALAASIQRLVPATAWTASMRTVVSEHLVLCGRTADASRKRRANHNVMETYSTAYAETYAFLAVPERQRAFAAANEAMVNHAIAVLEKGASPPKTQATTAANVAARPAATASRPGQHTDLKPHRLASMFPELGGEEFSALVEDIKARGLVHPIVRLNGEILDGWNRFRACLSARVVPVFEEYTGDDPVGFVISVNLTRRHLDSSQRADLGAQLMRLFEHEAKNRQRAGGNQAGLGRAKLPEPVARPREKAAAMVGASPRSVQDAATIRFGAKNQPPAVPEVIVAVQAGKLPVSQGVKLAREPEQTQKAVVKAVNSGQKPTAAMARRRLHP